MERSSYEIFAPLEVFTATVAPRLVRFAGVLPGQSVLDVGTRSGVLALAAAARGAVATGLDRLPRLLERARAHATHIGLDVTWVNGDIEALPFEEQSFDVVVSQFAFSITRPDVTTREMLRVLKPGGTIALASWPPELFMGRMFRMLGEYMPPEGPDTCEQFRNMVVDAKGVARPPPHWGTPDVVRERLGTSVVELVFDRATLEMPGLSVAHIRSALIDAIPPVRDVASSLQESGDPGALARFHRALDALVAQYFDSSRNVLRQDYLLARATKKAPHEHPSAADAGSNA